jgi:hypothetical protein
MSVHAAEIDRPCSAVNHDVESRKRIANWKA